MAFSNMSRTRAAPTPTNISTKSEPEIEKNGTFASPAMALAKRVLPVPGLPTNKIPRGIRPPNRWNFEGSRKKSTTSCTSSLASSQPATSAKVILLLEVSSFLALLLPKLKAPPLPPPCIWRMKNTHTPIKSNIGNQEINTVIQKDGSSSGVPYTCTPSFLKSSTIHKSPGLVMTYFCPSTGVTVISRPLMSTRAILPALASSINCV